VTDAVAVARQADLASQVWLIAVARVTALARRVLRLVVQAWELGLLMTRAARRRRGHTFRAVRAMARGAPRAQLAVRGGVLLLVTRCTGFPGGGAGVRLVAALAVAVTLPGGARFGGVTGAARLGGGAGVWLVTGATLSVARAHLGLLGSVAARAPREERLRPVRQAAVAPLTSAVPGVRRGGRDLGRVTPLTSPGGRELEPELVRAVTLHAFDPGVAAVVGGREGVARAARLRALPRVRARWMRIVAADARAGRAALGMIGMHPLVAALAGAVDPALHRVRRVAARALSVRGDLASPEHRLILVARSAVDRALFLEAMGSMATHALRVSTLKQRCLRDARLVALVAVHTRRPSVHGSSVLVLMARPAGLGRRLAARLVRGVHLLVTALAGRGPRLRVLVGAVAARALLRTVHLDRGERPHRAGMTPAAVGRRKWLQLRETGGGAARSARRRELFQRRLVTAPFHREGVAARAVCAHPGAPSLLSGALRVAQAPLLLVARGAAPQVDVADLDSAQIVAAAAGDFVLHDVGAVPADGTRHRPRLLNVHAFAPAPALGCAFVTTRDDQRKRDAHDQPQRGGGTRPAGHFGDANSHRASLARI
jgi:hypothetical protein